MDRVRYPLIMRWPFWDVDPELAAAPRRRGVAASSRSFAATRPVATALDEVLDRIQNLRRATAASADRYVSDR